VRLVAEDQIADEGDLLGHRVSWLPEAPLLGLGTAADSLAREAAIAPAAMAQISSSPGMSGRG